MLNELGALRSSFRFRNEWPFDVNTGNSTDGWSTIANRLQDFGDLLERRRRCCEQKRCRAASGVVVANGAKRVSRRFHRVAAKRAVHMEIDKSGHKIITVEINDLLFLMCRRSLVDPGDFSFLHHKFEPIANSIGKN